MKKLLTLTAACCLVLGTVGAASAIDLKVGGQWEFSFGYYSNTTFHKKEDTGEHRDRLRFRQRARIQTQFIADENLSAMFNAEIGDLNWGQGSSGGGLDADGKAIKVKRAYLDWTLPGASLKSRIGVQGLALPSVVVGNPIMDADAAGIVLSSQFSPVVGMTAFYSRPFDQGWGTESGGKNKFDEMDMFGVTLPITTDVVRATPWGMIALIGKDSGWYGSEGVGAVVGDSDNYAGRGRAPVRPEKLDGTGWAWWAGTTFELPAIDPFFVKLDAMMGGLESGDSKTDSFGYLVSTDVGYKFSFGALSFVGWYSSGDDDVDDRGTMPIVSDDGGLPMTSYGFTGGRFRSIDSGLSSTGLGMWGIGLKLADLSFVDNLTHTIRGMYMRGTNSGSAIDGEGPGNRAPWTWGYFLSSDSAWEIDLLNEYRVTENLTVALDLSYTALELGKQRTNHNDTTGNFAAILGIQYAF